jgi:glyoxylase-like metal-dependent hydrolase (beta-lactamase superfamily II)
MRELQGLTLTRRHLLKGVVGGAAGFAFGVSPRVSAAAAQAVSGNIAPGSGAVQRLADDLFLLQLPGEINVVAQTSAGGVVLVDGGSAKASDALMKTISELPGSTQVQTLFNTHWHPEQTGLNETIGKAGKTIISHENTRLWLSTDITWSWNGQHFKRLPKNAQPNKTFYTTGQLDTLSTGTPSQRSLDIKYGYIPDAAHTDGDMYVYFPKQNVLVVGDVVSNHGWPVVDWQTGGWIGGLAGALPRLVTLANDQTRIVPGRGPVMSLAELKTQATMYSTIYDRLSGLLNKGRGPSEAVAAKPTKEFDAQMGNPDEFVRRAFESLWAYLSPDA